MKHYAIVTIVTLFLISLSLIGCKANAKEINCDINIETVRWTVTIEGYDEDSSTTVLTDLKEGQIILESPVRLRVETINDDVITLKTASGLVGLTEKGKYKDSETQEYANTFVLKKGSSLKLESPFNFIEPDNGNGINYIITWND